MRLSESDKREMLEAARQYNEELLGNIELLDPFSSIKKEVRREISKPVKM